MTLSAAGQHLRLTVTDGANLADVVVQGDEQATIADLAEAAAMHLDVVAISDGIHIERTGERLPPTAAMWFSGLRHGDVVTISARPRTVQDLPDIELRPEPDFDITLRDADVDVTLRSSPNLEVSLRSHPAGNGRASTARGARPRVTIGVDDISREETVSTRRRLPPDPGHSTFNRPPRVLHPRTPDKFVFPVPPELPRKTRIPMIASLIPLVLAAVLWKLFPDLGVYMLMFAVMSPAMMLGTWWSDRRGGRKEYAENVTRFTTELTELGTRLYAAHAAQIAWREQSAPTPSELLSRALRRLPSLWERSLEHDDFLELRLGIATLPNDADLVLPERGDPALRAQAEQLADAYREVAGVPLTVSLREHRGVALAGTQSRTEPLAYWLAAQAAILHSPRELAIFGVFSPNNASRWDWLKWLPHCVGPEDRLAADRTSAVRMIESMLSRAREQDPTTTAAPATLLILDDAAGVPRASLNELISTDSTISLIWFGATSHNAPRDCGIVTQCGDALTVTETGVGRTWTGVRPDSLGLDAATRTARALSSVHDPGSAREAADMPSLVRLFDLLDGHRVADIERRWSRWTGRLSAPIGATRANTISVDLRADGPHALVAGTTGAGKSELLQSLVVSLAASHSPERVSFLFVDYKGGAAFKDCVHLPHVAGMVTDLDEHLSQRALTSLNAELRRRERMLREAEAKDLAEMERLDIEHAPPSLVIIVDEFAALAREIPDFVEGIVDIAQRGRSLGVHLVLATQRPGGVVSENIRANTNVRVALRVGSPAESDDVVMSKDAATISRSTPGRGYLRMGPGELLEFQSAYAGAPLSTGDSEGLVLQPFRLGNGAALTGRGPVVDEDATEMTLLVDTIRQAARRQQLPDVPTPWLPELPDRLPIAELRAGVDADAGRVHAGLVDVPSRQCREPLRIDFERDGALLIFGTSGSGKTMALRAIAAAFASGTRSDDLHIYAIDSGWGLGALEELPHCGSVIQAEDEPRVRRLLSELRSTIDARSTAMSRAGISTLAELRRTTHERVPRILVFIDDMTGLVNAYERIEYGALLDHIPRLVADARAVGIHFVITADRRSAVPSAIAASIPRRLVLRMADENEYANAGLDLRTVRGANLPPGRGFDGDGREIQFALVTDEPVPIVAGAPAPEIRLLPATVDRDALPAARGLRVPIGLRDADLSPAWVDLTQRHFVVSGPYRSGRSTVLGTLALSLRETCDLWLFAPRRTPLTELDCWVPDRVVTGVDAVSEALTEIDQLVESREPGASLRPVAVMIDDATEIADAPTAYTLEMTARRARDRGVHLAISGETYALRMSISGWIRECRKDSLGVLLDPDLDRDGDLLNARLPRHVPGGFPPGRGFLVENAAELTQCASWVPSRR